MLNVIIQGNYFELNTGQAQMEFADAHRIPLYNYIVRLENNYYNMSGGNSFVFAASGHNHVYMGYETGTAPKVELTNPDTFDGCQLRITGPLQFFGYKGKQASGNPICP
jgi:hypothetical protein